MALTNFKARSTKLTIYIYMQKDVEMSLKKKLEKWANGQHIYDFEK